MISPRLVVGLLTGVLFGVGLVLSGMTDPANVLGFLDLTGAWNPSLAFVMGGAVAVYALAWRLTARLRQRPALVGAAFQLPTRKDIDLPLVGGAALFGVGWGLVGFCPGPAVVGLGSGTTTALVFVASMLVGMALERALSRARGGEAAAVSSEEVEAPADRDLQSLPSSQDRAHAQA
ncbi:MAG: YeeE/YedE family protein [Deltaproteobacteria bacterium]|nr:YeeE/YedE family protein [Deltaproteobacteria bacterium]